MMNKKIKINQVRKFLLSLSLLGLILFQLNQSANASEIIDLDGNIKLRRKGENEFKSADYLDILNPEDEVQVSSNSWVIIRCITELPPYKFTRKWVKPLLCLVDKRA